MGNKLKPQTIDIIRKLAIKYHLKVVMLFGSIAKNKAQAKSDIDLAILADNVFYKKRFSDFNYDLMAAENAEKKEIEVVPIGNYNPILLFNIFDKGIPLYVRDKEEYQRLLSWVRFSYEDNRRFFYDREKLLEKRMAKLGKQETIFKCY